MSKSDLHRLEPACTVCGTPSAIITLEERHGEWLLGFSGLCGGNVPSPGKGSGDPITAERALAILTALDKEQPSGAELDAAGFYDDAGFCRDCERFYCATHWSVSASGGGTCPNGHFKSLDPHWSPDDDFLGG